MIEKIITINLHNCTREERKELEEYLEENCWDWIIKTVETKLL